MYPNHKEKFILSGSPRIDILRNKLKEYWNNKEIKKNILISSNFNLVNGYIATSKIVQEISITIIFILESKASFRHEE